MNKMRLHKGWRAVAEVCDVRDGARCKDCVHYGHKCNNVKAYFGVDKPYMILDANEAHVNLIKEREERKNGKD